MIETQTTINGIKLNFAWLNNGKPPLVMLHGVTRRWPTFIPVIQALSSRWDVHAMDFRGHGQSGRADAYQVIDYVNDVVNFIRHQFTSQVVIYGHSLGAMVAAAAAAQLTGKVRAVVMEDPPMQTMGERISKNILHSFFAGLSDFAGDTRSVPTIAADLAEVSLHDPENNHTLRLGDIRDSVQLRFTAASLKRVDPQVFLSILAGQWLNGYDAENIFRSMPCPALLMQADMKSGGMLPDHDAAELKRWAADMTHVKLDGIGHVIHVSATQQLVNLVSSFLESLD